MNITEQLAALDAAYHDAHDGPVETPADLYHVRRVALEIRELEQRENEVVELAARIADDYRAERDRLRDQIETRKLAILGYTNQHGTARIPDVGTFSATRRKPTVSVADEQAALVVARELDPEGRELWRAELNRTKAKAQAQKALDERGELLPGFELEPARVTLRSAWHKPTTNEETTAP